MLKTAPAVPLSVAPGALSLTTQVSGVLPTANGGNNKSTVQFATPATAGSVTAAATDRAIIIKPAGTIAALTVTLPTAAQSADGDIIFICCTQIVTTLTVAAGSGASVVNALAAFVAGGFMTFVYRATDTTFYRCG